MILARAAGKKLSCMRGVCRNPQGVRAPEVASAPVVALALGWGKQAKESKEFPKLLLVPSTPAHHPPLAA